MMKGIGRSELLSWIEVWRKKAGFGRLVLERLFNYASLHREEGLVMCLARIEWNRLNRS